MRIWLYMIDGMGWKWDVMDIDGMEDARDEARWVEKKVGGWWRRVERIFNQVNWNEINLISHFYEWTEVEIIASEINKAIHWNDAKTNLF